MTKHRSFKCLVRARMAKTGESYTAAWALLLAAAEPKASRERVLRGRRAWMVRAVIGHAPDFLAWRSLRRQGLTNDEAVGFIVRTVRCVTRNA
jgi:hypothetical protein